jgi:hypothetical protein
MRPLRPVNRPVKPLMPAHAYKTYEIDAPLPTHFRPATCAEVGCREYERGWVSPIDERTLQGQRWAYRIRKVERRKYTEFKDPGGLTVFTFDAGQRCFAEHRLPVGRPELFVVRGGDWRGNPRGEVRRHTRPEFWVEDFALHQQAIVDERNKG